MILRSFHENSHYRNVQFRENHKNHIMGGFVKILEFTLVIIFVIFPQILKFTGILPIFFCFRAAKSRQRGLLELYKCAYDSGPDRQGC